MARTICVNAFSISLLCFVCLNNAIFVLRYYGRKNTLYNRIQQNKTSPEQLDFVLNLQSTSCMRTLVGQKYDIRCGQAINTLSSKFDRKIVF